MDVSCAVTTPQQAFHATDVHVDSDPPARRLDICLGGDLIYIQGVKHRSALPSWAVGYRLHEAFRVRCRRAHPSNDDDTDRRVETMGRMDEARRRSCKGWVGPMVFQSFRVSFHICSFDQKGVTNQVGPTCMTWTSKSGPMEATPSKRLNLTATPSSPNGSKPTRLGHPQRSNGACCTVFRAGVATERRLAWKERRVVEGSCALGGGKWDPGTGLWHGEDQVHDS